MGAIFCPGCRSHIAAEAPSCTGCGLVRPPPGWPVDAQIGRVILGKYRVDRRLSAGGFGTVFIATQVHGDLEMGRVILKFLHQEHASDPTVTKRFLNEVKTARELINSHIVRVFDLGYDEDGTPFMVQEFIEGEGLDEVLRAEKRLDPGRAIKIASQVAEGMAEANRKGIIHRDLKPENLRLQKDSGLVKILDFGIARISSSRGTATNSFIGTPRYMPPEQIKQLALDNGVDIFALGVILFEMLAGEPPIPFQQSELEYIHLNLIQDPRRLKDLLPDCPDELSDLVGAMIAKDRALRPPDMEAVMARLESIALQHGWSDEVSTKFRLAPGAAGGRGATRALPTRDRTPSPARADEEVLELVPARKPHVLLYLGIGGGSVAAVALVLFFLLRGGGQTTPTADAPSAAPAVVDDAGTPNDEAGADAGAKAADAAPDAKHDETVADAGADPGAPPEASVKVEPDAAPDTAPDAGPPEAAADTAAPPDATPVAEVPERRDAGSRRDAGRRDAGARADTGGTRDTGGSADTFTFGKVGGTRDGGPR